MSMFWMPLLLWYAYWKVALIRKQGTLRGSAYQKGTLTGRCAKSNYYGIYLKLGNSRWNKEQSYLENSCILSCLWLNTRTNSEPTLYVNRIQKQARLLLYHYSVADWYIISSCWILFSIMHENYAKRLWICQYSAILELFRKIWTLLVSLSRRYVRRNQGFP